MSIDPTASNNSTQFRMDEVPLHRNSRKETDSPIDSELVDQTKNQIRALVQEIADLAKSDCSEEDFYQGFLTRTTSALASVGGVIWTRPSNEQALKLLYQINLKRTNLVNDSTAQLQHSLLLKQFLDSPEPTVIAPNSGADEPDQAGNPTEFLLILSPLSVDSETIGLIEIFQRSGGGPATQRGYLRFLAQMSEIASNFLKTRRLRSFQMQQELWRDIDQFSRSVHGSLDTDQTAFVIANDGRRIVGCDRISVATRIGPRYRIAAVSGLDTIERRADQIKRLAQLAGTVVRTGEPLWYTGDDSKLAPQIETQLHAYIDKSHAKLLAVIPLYRKNSESTSKPRPEPLGAIIIEQIADINKQSMLERRAQIIAEHAETALSNAVEHNSIFLMPLWKQLGWLSAPFTGARFPKTVTLITAIAAVVFGLCVVPYPFEIGGTGELIAETQREIYSPKGRLIDVYEPTDPDEIVPAGAVLAQLEDNELSVQIERIVGELKQNQEQKDKLFRLQTENLDRLEKINVVSEMAKAEENIESLQSELQIKTLEAEQLTIRSPIAGHVANWQLRRNLLGRPVEPGQNLMTLVAPDTKWQLEVLVPERRMGHLLAAQNKTKEPLSVTFALASNPSQQFSGRILQVDSTLDVYDDNGNTCRMLVEFDNSQVPESLLRSGTRVTTKVNCGTRSVGFVLFHELYETLKSSYLYWF